MAMALTLGKSGILPSRAASCTVIEGIMKASVTCVSTLTLEEDLAPRSTTMWRKPVSWSLQSRYFTGTVLEQSSQPSQIPVRTVMNIRGENEEENTNGQEKSQAENVSETESPQASLKTEREIWDMFMQAEATEEKALDAQEDSKETTGARVATAVLQPNEQRKGQKSQATRYLLHTQGEGKVRVVVNKCGSQYAVEILVDSSRAGPKSDIPLKLHWGLFRSDSSEWVLLEPEEAPRETVIMKGEVEAMQTPLLMGPRGTQTLTLKLDSSMAPFFVNFLLLRPATANEEDFWIRDNQGNNFCIPIGMGRGRPDALGVTWNRDGSVNFALYSRHAENVVLCLYESDAIEPSLEIDLERSIHRTGDVWHVLLESLGPYTRYGYRCKGQIGWETGNRFHARHVLLDPYAKYLAPNVPGQEDLPSPAPVLGWLKKESSPFDWEDDAALHDGPILSGQQSQDYLSQSISGIPLEALVAYRLHVRCFTGEADDLEERLQGTFLGLLEKVSHLHRLGVNAVIMQPVFAFDEGRGCYFPKSFFSLMGCYGSSGDSLSASSAMKKLVKELHKNGIEVILDVVFSHTAENGDEAPNTFSFRGIDNATYYICDQFGVVAKSEFGTENLLNCNHPAVQKLIIDSLQYLVEEYHVDGFCFTNASSLVTGPHGQELSRPVLVEAITFDPLLAGAKLIVDSCSPINGVGKELTFPHWKRWCEWNTQYKIDVRRFLRGEQAQLSSFATRLYGSGDMFADGRGTQYSINHITAPYGLTLTDLVSYSEPEGETSEYSWNCGHEGPTDDPSVIETRVKQVRNFLTTLFLSQGVPVLNMGDEYGNSKDGMITVDNSTSFHWDAVDMEFGKQTMHLIASLVALRTRRKDLLQRAEFLDVGMLTWHGMQPEKPLWETTESNILAVSLHSKSVQKSTKQTFADMYIAYNPHPILMPIILPNPPKGLIWVQILDTSLPFPDNFSIEGKPIKIQFEGPSPCYIYNLQAHSSMVLEARPGTPSGKPIRASAPMAGNGSAYSNKWEDEEPDFGNRLVYRK